MSQLNVVFALLAATLVTQRSPTIKARVDLVTVDVLVTHGLRPVGGLTLDDFEVRDNGVVQELASVDRDTTPLDLYVALDTSQSVKGRVFRDLVAAARAALEQLRPEDRAGVFTFSDLFVNAAALTHDRESVQRSLDAAEPYGSTRLFDTMMTAVLLADAPGRRSLLLVYTDGVDTTSWIGPRDVQEASSKSDVVIYVIAPQQNLPRNPRNTRRSAVKTGEYSLPVNQPPASIIVHEKPPLEALARETGGRFVEVSNTHELARVFREMVSEFRTRYLLSYYPEDVALEGWHKLDVRVKRRGFDVQARRGYYVQPTKN